MKKELVPHKIIIDFENNTFKNGIFLYRVKEDGVMVKGFKSIAIKNMGFSIPQMNDILSKVKNKTKDIEKIKEEKDGN